PGRPEQRRPDRAARVDAPARGPAAPPEREFWEVWSDEQVKAAAAPESGSADTGEGAAPPAPAPYAAPLAPAPYAAPLAPAPYAAPLAPAPYAAPAPA